MHNKNLRIAILTTARSDFGLLKKVIALAAKRFGVDLLVAGSHFLTTSGQTVTEIESEFSFCPSIKLVHLNAMFEENFPEYQVKTLAYTQLKASEWFGNNRCDMLLFLGDRWELWGVTLAAFMHGIPLAHISGGEVTEGVIDDCVRHSHTKISCLHFVANEKYAGNLSMMGEEDWRISITGECGLDEIHDGEMTTAEQIMDLFKVDLSSEIILVTFHPSTLDFETSISQQIESLLVALSNFPSCQIIFTQPGMESGSEIVLDAIHKFIVINDNAKIINHFGRRNYLTVMKHSRVVVGNSSSGLVEAASLGVPAINIGNRQKNRLSAYSVQHVSYSSAEIISALGKALTADYQLYSRQSINPYDPYNDGKNSLRVVNAIERALTELPRARLLIKKFNTQVLSHEWNYLLNVSR